MTKKDTQVWLVTYSHEYGTDVWANESEDAALKSATAHMLEWAPSEIDDDVIVDAIAEHAKAGRYKQALTMYAANTDEWFDVRDSFVMTDAQANDAMIPALQAHTSKKGEQE